MLKGIDVNDIKVVSKEFFNLLSQEEQKTKDDIKKYLDKTALGSEDKFQRYAQFVSEIYALHIQASITNAVQVVINDSEVELAKIKAQTAQQELEIAKEKLKMAQQELEMNKSKMYLENAKAIVQFDNITAQTISETRKNGSIPTQEKKGYKCPVTNQEINFTNMSFEIAEPTDKEKGLIGVQMKQLEKQAKSWNDHTMLQMGNQVVQLSSTALSESITSIDGLLATHKNILHKLDPDVVDDNYKKIK